MTEMLDRPGLAPREQRIRRALELVRTETTDSFEHLTRFEPTDYTSPEVARRERDLVFGKVPSIVCHGSEVAKPNAFITVQMPRNRVIVVRQRDGSVKAFVNACRHRGALLEPEAKGTCRLFSCAYHRWSYDTDGTLRAVTRDTTFGDFDRDGQGLVELPCEERHGFIWMIDSAEPGLEIDVQAWLGPEMDAILAGYRLQDLVTYRGEGFDEPVNWKIMQDAFLDSYHIQYAHPNTAAKIIHCNVVAAEDFGRHMRFVAPRKTIDRWLEEDPGEQSLAKDVTETHFLLPNSTLLRLPDDHFELLTFRPHPKEPGRSRMEMRVLVPPLEASGMEPERWERVWQKNWDILLAVLHQEDFPLLRACQEAVESSDAGDMILGRNEFANQVFHRELRALLS